MIDELVAFLDGRLSLASFFFLFKVALTAAVGVDPNAYPYCLRAVADFLTNAL